MGFGEYLGSFFPFFAIQHVLLAAPPLGCWHWTLSGGQLAAVLAILVLTVINYFGVRAGAGVQNVLTAVKVGAMRRLRRFRPRLAPARPPVGTGPPLPPAARCSPPSGSA